MRLVSLALIAAGSLAAGSLTAVAADLPVKAPAAVMAPVSTWTGCYIGGNVGGAWGSGSIHDSLGVLARSGDNSGFVGGAQIGCDVQTGAWVFGIRNLFDWSDRSSTGTISTGAFSGYSATLKNNWIDLLTGRIGFLAQPNWLFYFQGGAAWRESSLRVFDPTGLQVADSGRTRTGWTIGGGTEWKFAPNWSVFLEYDYADFGRRSATITTIPPGVAVVPISDTISARSNVQMVLVGLNWRWSSF